MTRTSLLTCPACGSAQALEMPIDACLFFHECGTCHVVLRPKPGDCCVCCSYGSVPCPPMQADATSVRGGAGCCDSGAPDARP